MSPKQTIKKDYQELNKKGLLEKEGILLLDLKDNLGEYHLNLLKQEQEKYGFQSLDDWCIHIIGRSID